MKEETIKKHEYLRYKDYYECRGIGTRARNDKVCNHCGQYIPQGVPHDMHHFYPEFDAVPVHKECHDDFMASLIREGDDISRKIRRASPIRKFPI